MMSTPIQHRCLKANAPQAGFALVVTLTLMILLTIIAVGLLTLAPTTP